jgi:uncharacterized phosphosugar-binding protein
MNAYDRYYDAAKTQFDAVYTSQRAAIAQAAEWLGDALANDRWLYAFGTGHSHMLAEEVSIAPADSRTRARCSTRA